MSFSFPRSASHSTSHAVRRGTPRPLAGHRGCAWLARARTPCARPSAGCREPGAKPGGPAAALRVTMLDRFLPEPLFIEIDHVDVAASPVRAMGKDPAT